MKFSKLTLAIATTLGASASFSAFAIELYVDTKTKQIYAEPGRGRVLMGSFEQVGAAAPAKAAAPVAAPAEIDAIKQDLELKTNEIKALEEHAAETELVKTKLGDKGLEIETQDGNFKIAMGGRLQVDAEVNSNGSNIPQTAKLNDGIGVRRGRLHMDGTLYKDFDFKFEYDFVRGSGTNAAGITDAWVEYTGLKPISFTIGQFKEPFSLESVTSNRFLTFNERSLPNNAFIEFANPYLLGLSAQTYGERYTGRIALQSEPIGNGNYNNNTSLNGNGNANRNGPSGNPSYGVTGRATFLPFFNSKTELLHAGVAASYRSVNNTSNGTQAMQFASQVANVDRSNWANTGGLTDAVLLANGQPTPNRRVLENFYRVGGELAGVYGPASFQAEYMHTQLNGQNYGSSDHLEGYYVFGSYFLTGESRNYSTKKGAFDRQKPNKNFSLKNGGWGAWEVAARFDSLDMNTQHVNGGNLQNGTLALNWYLNPHVRFMADVEHVFTNSVINTGFIRSSNSSLLATNGQHPNIFMFRTQIDW
ncbi:MAG: porin [Methylococcales bacterium]|nr:porin [Methylococcales bacterium]